MKPGVIYTPEATAVLNALPGTFKQLSARTGLEHSQVRWAIRALKSIGLVFEEQVYGTKEFEFFEAYDESEVAIPARAAFTAPPAPHPLMGMFTNPL